MNKKQIKDLALSNGFKLKEQPSGKMDLNPYVYDFADALLAKANERVAELESQHQLLTKQIEPLLDMQEDGEYYTRCDLADDIYEAFIEGSSVDALNKFAIEKKQEAILTIKDKWIKKASEMPPQLECRSKGSSCYNWAMFYARELKDEAEQLRKEQDDD